MEEIAGKIARSLNVSSELAETIARSMKRGVLKQFGCSRCGKKFNIPNARDGKIYRCVSCRAALSPESGFADADLILDEAIPTEVQQAMRDEKNITGRYVAIEKMSEDSTKAFDLELMRYVVLKPVALERSPALVKLEHKGIARIYDVSVSYVARQFVAGRALTQIQPTEEMAISIVRAMCEAVHYAHKHGVQHGNLNPDNVIIDENSTPIIINFGLAPTTPDIKAIGILLGYLLGRISPEYQIPPEIRAIMGHSYNSVLEIETELRRYQTGFPVAAYSTGLTYRIRKAIKRNSILYLIVLVTCIAVAGAAYFALMKSSETRQEVSHSEDILRNEQVLAEQRTAAAKVAENEKEKSSRLIAALIFDISSAHREAIERRRSGESFAALRSIPQRILESPLYKQAESETANDYRVRYSFGRLYRIIGDDARATTEQNAALKLEADAPLALYERGILGCRNYRRMIRKLRHDWRLRQSQGAANGYGSPVSAEPRDLEIEDELAKKVRIDASKDLDSAAMLLPADSIESLTALAVVDAMNAFDARASQRFKVVMDRDKSCEDAVLFMCEVVLHNASLPDEIAIKIISDALKEDRGNITLYMKRGDVYTDIAERKHLMGEDSLDCFNRAISDFTKVLELHPDCEDALIERAKNWGAIGLYTEQAGKSPDEAYSKSAADFAEAARKFPDSFEAALRYGALKCNLAFYRFHSGANATEEFKQANALLDRAIEISPDRAEAWTMRGGMWTNRGLVKIYAGEDPAREHEAAVKDFEMAISLNSRDFEAWKSLGELWSNWGLYRKLGGGDPGESYSKAVRCLDSAIAINDAASEAWVRRGAVWKNWGAYKVAIDTDASKENEQALSDLNKAVELNSTSYQAFWSRGSTYLNIAIARSIAMKDPTDDLNCALRDLDSAIQLNGSDWQSRCDRGNLHFSMAMHFEQNGKNSDAADHYKYAAEDWKRALTLKPNLDSQLSAKIAHALKMSGVPGKEDVQH